MLKFISGLLRTKQQFTSKLATLFRGKKTIDPDLLAELETILLSADVGLETTEQIIDYLKQNASRDEDPEITLKNYLAEILAKCARPLEINSKPFVILMVGVNGAGKTTTIGKIAKQLQAEGKKRNASCRGYIPCRCN